MGVSLDESVAAFADDVGDYRAGHDHRARHPWWSGRRLSNGACAGGNRLDPGRRDDRPLRCGYAGGRARSGARRVRPVCRDSRLRHGRRGLGGGAKRPATARVGAGARHGPPGEVRLVPGRGGEGRRADREERQRVRPLSTARRIVRHARVPGGGDPAHPTAAGARAVVHQPAGPVGSLGRAVPADLGALGRLDELGAARRASRRRRRAGRGCGPRGRRRRARPAAAPMVGSACANSPRCRDEPPGTFVAEIGVGIVHHSRPAPKVLPDAETIELHRRIRMEFDPTGRLNPGLDVLTGP